MAVCLEKVRSELPKLSVSDIEDRYIEWVNDNQFLVFRAWEPGFKAAGHYRYVASKVPKRGNDKYAYRIKRRFLALAQLSQASGLSSLVCDVRGVSVLFVTLTYDTKRCSLLQAWENIGLDVNRFLACIKKHYGRVHVVRTFEAFKRTAYPHVHMILHFPDHYFKVHSLTRRHFKNGHMVVRTKLAVEDSINTQLATFHHSFIDVEGVENLPKAMAYLSKYIIKSCSLKHLEYDSKKYNNPRSLRTLAMCWVHRKRAFSIGKCFKAWLLLKHLPQGFCYKNTSPPSERVHFAPLAGRPLGCGRGGFLACYGRKIRLDRTLSAIQTDMATQGVDARRNWVASIMDLEGNARRIKWQLLSICPKKLFKQYSSWKSRWNFGLMESEGLALLRCLNIDRHRMDLWTLKPSTMAWDIDKNELHAVAANNHPVLVTFDVSRNALSWKYTSKC